MSDKQQMGSSQRSMSGVQIHLAGLEIDPLNPVGMSVKPCLPHETGYWFSAGQGAGLWLLLVYSSSGVTTLGSDRSAGTRCIAWRRAVVTM